jgi:hypothetical protein
MPVRVAALAALAGTRLLLAWMPGDLIRWAATPSSPAARLSNSDRVAAAFAHALSLLPLSSTCLERAVALRLLLAPLCPGARVVIGVQRDGDSLRAHAWVERPGVSYGAGAAAEELVPLPIVSAAPCPFSVDTAFTA